MNAREDRIPQIDRLVAALDYSFEAERYGVKLLRTALNVLSDDTLGLMENHLKEFGAKGRTLITALLADQTEEVLREALTFGDAMGIDDVDAMSRILDGIRTRPEFVGAKDLSRFDDEGRKAIRAFCMVQGAFYRVDPGPDNTAGPYPVDPVLFRIVFQNPDRAITITRLLDLRDEIGLPE